MIIARAEVLGHLWLGVFYVCAMVCDGWVNVRDGLRFSRRI